MYVMDFKIPFISVYFVDRISSIVLICSVVRYVDS